MGEDIYCFGASRGERERASKQQIFKNTQHKYICKIRKDQKITCPLNSWIKKRKKKEKIKIKIVETNRQQKREKKTESTVIS